MPEYLNKIKEKIESDPELSVYADIAKTGLIGLKGITDLGISAFKNSSPIAGAFSEAGNQSPAQSFDPTSILASQIPIGLKVVKGQNLKTKEEILDAARKTIEKWGSLPFEEKYLESGGLLKPSTKAESLLNEYQELLRLLSKK